MICLDHELSCVQVYLELCMAHTSAKHSFSIVELFCFLGRSLRLKLEMGNLCPRKKSLWSNQAPLTQDYYTVLLEAFQMLPGVSFQFTKRLNSPSPVLLALRSCQRNWILISYNIQLDPTQMLVMFWFIVPQQSGSYGQ